MKIGLIQMPVCVDEAVNLEVAAKEVEILAKQGADLVVLPEIFVCPYDTTCFPTYAQAEGAETWKAIAQMAKNSGVYLVGGTVPEKDGEKVYNTSYVFDPAGVQIAKHRKIHLFDIDVKGGQYFKESDTLTAGDSITMFDTKFGKFGLMICFDVRFPELSLQMAEKGAQAIFVPAAFNPTTGPAHWEILFKGRAVDNQCYMVGVSSATGTEKGYKAYGHSIVVSPWGEVLLQMGGEVRSEIVEVDLSRSPAVRAQIPLWEHRAKARYDFPS